MSAAGNRRLRLVSSNGTPLVQPNKPNLGSSCGPTRSSEACSIWERSEAIPWTEFLEVYGDHPDPHEDLAGAEAYHAALRRWFEHNGKMHRAQEQRAGGLRRAREALGRVLARSALRRQSS